MDEFIKIRKQLHSQPELSENETNTASYLKELYQSLSPDEIIENVGGTGLIVGFDTKKPGKTLMFRSELDALPIQEINEFEHKSQNPGVAHLCGHDGHSAILFATASKVKDNLDKLSGKIYFLHQPAEENAVGARKVVESEKFKKIAPDFIYALHNIPKYKLGSVVVKRGVFASASVGFIGEFKGRTSHAAHPENAVYPAPALANSINAFLAVPMMNTRFDSANAVNVIHAKLGEVAFGTTPGEAVIMATIRSHSDSDLSKMTLSCEKIIRSNASAYSLKYEVKLTDEFTIVENDDEAYEHLIKAANDLYIQVEEKQEPFSWSEDFGFYSKDYKTVLFGLGSGLDHPQLHNPDYDFPDELIKIGSDIFYKIIENNISDS